MSSAESCTRHFNTDLQPAFGEHQELETCLPKLGKVWKKLVFSLNTLKKLLFCSFKKISLSSVLNATCTSWVCWRLASCLFFTPSIYKKKQKSKYLRYLTIYGFTYQIFESFWYLIPEYFFIYICLIIHPHHFMATTTHGIHKYHKPLLFVCKLTCANYSVQDNETLHILLAKYMSC